MFYIRFHKLKIPFFVIILLNELKVYQKNKGFFINNQLIKHNSTILTKEDFKNCLMDIGIKAGDMICVHTEIFNLGTPLLKKKNI